MVLDATLPNTQHYKVRIKGNVEQSWKRSSAPLLHQGVGEGATLKREPSGLTLDYGRQLYFTEVFTEGCRLLVGEL